MSVEDKFQPSSRKEGSLSATSSGVASSRLAVDMRFGDLLESPLWTGCLYLSVAYPKGITFPLGSCLSGTNSRNSKRLLPAKRQFFSAKSSYQRYGRTAISFPLLLLIGISSFSALNSSFTRAIILIVTLSCFSNIFLGIEVVEKKIVNIMKNSVTKNNYNWEYRWNEFILFDSTKRVRNVS